MNIIRTITRFLAAALVMTAAFGCDKNLASATSVAMHMLLDFIKEEERAEEA